MNPLDRRSRQRWWPVVATGVAAVGVGAMAAYYWRDNIQDNARDLYDCVSKYFTLTRNPEPEQAKQTDIQIEQTLEKQYEFIKNVSTPQEVEGLLLRLHEVFNKVTDIQSIQPQLDTAANAAEKLTVLSTLYLCKALTPCLLIPLLDLLVRLKLHLIGRHLTVQQALIPAADNIALKKMIGSIPPDMSEMVVNAFLCSDHFVDVGCGAVISKVMASMEEVLKEVPMDQPLLMSDIVQLMFRVLDTLWTSCDWTDILLGPAQQVQENNIYHVMLCELDSELRESLNHHKFRDALNAAINVSLTLLIAKLDVHGGAAQVPPTQTLTAENASMRPPSSGDELNQSETTDAARSMAQQEAKPLARYLKTIQSAGDDLFADAKSLSKEICDLKDVTKLCSVVFSNAAWNV